MRRKMFIIIIWVKGPMKKARKNGSKMDFTLLALSEMFLQARTLEFLLTAVMTGIVRFIKKTRKQLEYREKQKKGEFEPARNKDALHMALGEKLDHPGRVRGVGGVNVGIRKVYVGSNSKAKKICQSTED